jgi:hypothetical protein
VTGIVGRFDLHSKPGSQGGLLQLEFLPLDFITEWHRVGLTSDFVGDYLSYQFVNPAWGAQVLSTVCNELLENAVKFSGNPTLPIRLRAWTAGERLTLEVQNTTGHTAAALFRRHSGEVVDGEPEALFIARTASLFEARDSSAPGLGLILLRKDYNAELAMNFKADAVGEEVAVFVRATLSIDEEMAHG